MNENKDYLFKEMPIRRAVLSLAIPWATPISDWVALVVSMCLLIPFLRRFRNGIEVEVKC